MLVCWDKASTHGRLCSRKQACHAPHATLGHGRQSLIWGEATCRMWRGIHQGVHWSWRTTQKATCFNFKMHAKWGEEARNLFTNISDWQLPRYSRKGSWEKYKCLLVPNQEFNYQNRCNVRICLLNYLKLKLSMSSKDACPSGIISAV